MKNLFSVFCLVVFLLSLAPTDADAQSFSKRRRYYTVGVSLNAMNYFGDIVPESDFTSLRLKSTRPNIGLNYSYRMFPRISFRGSLSWGRITGDDSKSASENESDNLPRYKRNINFRNDIKELSTVAMFDLYENRGAYTRRPDFTPYGFIGIAVFHHNPKTYNSGANGLEAGFYDLHPLGTEGQYVADREDKGYPEPYRKIQFAIPLGIGFKYKLDKQWDLGFEIGWRKTFFDYLDDVSGNYAAKSDLLASDPSGTAARLSDRSSEAGEQYPLSPDPELGAAYPHIQGYGTKGDQRGDITDDDWFIVTGINLSYILPSRTRSPKFR